jgi:hypothetical protein
MIEALSHEVARVTCKGILFEKLHYTCQTAEMEQWFDHAALEDTWLIDVYFNPDNMNEIFWRSEPHSSNFEVCELLPTDRPRDDGLDKGC